MHVGHMQCLGQLESRNEWKSNELWSKSNPAVLGLVLRWPPRGGFTTHLLRRTFHCRLEPSLHVFCCSCKPRNH